MINRFRHLPWSIPEREATPESIFLGRRQLLRAATILGLAAVTGTSAACGPAKDAAIIGANVDPKVPHPRWSQATEKMIDTGERRPTLPYNGYGEWVAGLYSKNV